MRVSVDVCAYANLFVYAYTYVQVYVCLCMCMCAGLYVSVEHRQLVIVNRYIYIPVHSVQCTGVHMYMNTRVHMIHTYACVHIYICVCVYA